MNVVGYLKRKNQIKNYKAKARILRAGGWETWYHDDNWVKTEWINEGRKIDMMGRSTDDVYDELMEGIEDV